MVGLSIVVVVVVVAVLAAAAGVVVLAFRHSAFNLTRSHLCPRDRELKKSKEGNSDLRKD